jgi:tRNA pseudouridine(55) synthase
MVPEIPRYVFLEKNVGQTPLECVELWRKTQPQLASFPLAYAGRLDPMASGLLLVLIGEECKNQTNYHNLDKEYEFEILFGLHSDSGDVLGIVEEVDKKIITEEQIRNILSEFVGVLEVPYPIFSAKTVQGKPLHTWTMENRLHEITIPTRKSKIFSLELLNYQTLSRSEITEKSLTKIETIPPVTDIKKALGNDFRRPEVRKAWNIFSKAGFPNDQFSITKIKCVCSSGTYMRTLSEIIAKRLGSAGLAFSIHRTKIGHYNTESKSLDRIQ